MKTGPGGVNENVLANARSRLFLAAAAFGDSFCFAIVRLLHIVSKHKKVTQACY